jgi:hypothetical protein
LAPPVSGASKVQGASEATAILSINANGTSRPACLLSLFLS